MNTEEEMGSCVKLVQFEDSALLGPDKDSVPANYTISITGPLQVFATTTVGAGSSVVDSQSGSGSLGAGLLFCFTVTMISAVLLV